MDERKTRHRMGDRTVAFVQKNAEYATNSAGVVPAYVDVAELKVRLHHRQSRLQGHRAQGPGCPI